MDMRARWAKQQQYEEYMEAAKLLWESFAGGYAKGRTKKLLEKEKILKEQNAKATEERRKVEAKRKLQEKLKKQADDRRV